MCYLFLGQALRSTVLDWFIVRRVFVRKNALKFITNKTYTESTKQKQTVTMIFIIQWDSIRTNDCRKWKCDKWCVPTQGCHENWPHFAALKNWFGNYARVREMYQTMQRVNTRHFELTFHAFWHSFVNAPRSCCTYAALRMCVLLTCFIYFHNIEHRFVIQKLSMLTQISVLLVLLIFFAGKMSSFNLKVRNAVYFSQYLWTFSQI